MHLTQLESSTIQRYMSELGTLGYLYCQQIDRHFKTA